VLVAPLYWIWADPRRLLLLQVVGASRALDAGRR